MEHSEGAQLSSIRRRFMTFVAAILAACMIVIGGAATANAAVVVGVCKLKIGDPHGSTHVSRTINTLSNITCTIGMPSVHIQTFLYKAPNKHWTGAADSEVDVPAGKKLQSNRAVSCKEGPASPQ